MRPGWVAAVLAAVMASGCFGSPAGVVDYGDAVELEMWIEDPQAQVEVFPRVPITRGPTRLSAGDEVVFPGVAPALLGHRAGDDVALRVVPEPAYVRVTVDALLAPMAAVRDVPVRQVMAAPGHPAEQGQRVLLDGYSWELEGLTPGSNGTLVRLRVDLAAPDGPGAVQARPVDLGGTLVSTLQGDQVQRRLEPAANRMFLAQPGNLLGLEPGVYRHLGAEADRGDRLALAQLPAGQGLATLFDDPVVAHLRIVSVHDTPRDPYGRYDGPGEAPHDGWRESPHA